MIRPGSVFVAISLTVALLAPAHAQTPSPSVTVWQNDVRALLARRAAAVEANDLQTFQATMANAPEEFRKEKTEWFRRLHTLPLGTYRLDFAGDEFGEVTRERDRRGGEVHVIQVKERIGLRGYDVRASAEDLFLTVRKGDGGWSVVSDDDAEDLALQSTRNLWDFGPVSHIEQGGIMVVFHAAERAAAPKVLAAAKTATDHAHKSWPVPWREDRIVIMIPSGTGELARILQTTFDLSTFVAFAVSSVDRSNGYTLTGARVFLNWPNFRRYGATFQQTILRHEFTHLATRELSGIFLRSFMEEGMAQYYGEEQYNPATPELRQRVRAGRFDRHVPPDWLFTAGPPSDIFLAYEEAVDFISYVGSRFDRTAGARLYRAVGAESAVSPGTWRYHLDRACRATLGVGFDSLERDWARAVVKELS